ncbi:hypothetical protein HY495_01700 [Candidatus Woesearchaeota archaeon]|nr:hypothetical protein [Candidatus Woesearchaeota archaeon]
MDYAKSGEDHWDPKLNPWRAQAGSGVVAMDFSGFYVRPESHTLGRDEALRYVDARAARQIVAAETEQIAPEEKPPYADQNKFALIHLQGPQLPLLDRKPFQSLYELARRQMDSLPTRQDRPPLDNIERRMAEKWENRRDSRS